MTQDSEVASWEESRLTEIDWRYVSGFFDGDGGVNIDFGRRKRVLRLAFTISQKSREALEMIQLFLRNEGVHSFVGTMSDGTSYLRVWRDKDILLMGRKMMLLVKSRQVEATMKYLEGRITGSEYLRVMEGEFEHGRRKSRIPVSAIYKFPLTKPEAKKLALQIASRAGGRANRSNRRIRLLSAYHALPDKFRVVDLMNQLEVQRPAAIDLGYNLVDLGLVTVERIPREGRAALEFTKMVTNPAISSHLPDSIVEDKPSG